MEELPKRKPNRLKDYDYRKAGTYFVTVCAKGRNEIFGEIVGATVLGRPHTKLSDLGAIIETAIKYYHANGIAVFDGYVIMPNHAHFIMVIEPKAGDRGRSPLQYLVRNLKSYVTKKAGFSPWQKSFHDHIIRSESDYIRIKEYIANNPANWEQDCFRETATGYGK